jgi:hypothetical protein
LLLDRGLIGAGITAFAAIVLITSSLSVSPVAAQSQADGPHCYSGPLGNYDAAWCLYERTVMNHPRCIEIWTEYNEMLKGYTFDTSKLVRNVDKDCQLPPPPDHPPPSAQGCTRQYLDRYLSTTENPDPSFVKRWESIIDYCNDDPKSETPITGCESYTGTQYDDCINSQLDDSLKGVKDPCGDPSNPNYVKCLLGNKPYTPKIQRGQQLGLGPCSLENSISCYPDVPGRQDDPTYYRPPPGGGWSDLHYIFEVGHSAWEVIEMFGHFRAGPLPPIFPKDVLLCPFAPCEGSDTYH